MSDTLLKSIPVLENSKLLMEFIPKFVKGMEMFTEDLKTISTKEDFDGDSLASMQKLFSFLEKPGSFTKLFLKSLINLHRPGIS